METTFKYQGKIITTPNLEKKLKRMKISVDDIEIINTPIKKEKSNEGIEDYMLNKRKVIVRSTLDETRRVCYIPIDYTPTIYKLFKHHLWNPITHTGIRDITEETLMTMYYNDLLCKNETC